MLQSQDLTNRITILRKTSSPNEDGFEKDTWIEYKKVWAKANTLFGIEYWAAKEYSTEDTVVFTIRYNACPDLSINDQIMFKSRKFNINSVDNVLFKNEMLKVKAKEVIK